MYEASQVWTLVGADGTTVTFNDGNGWYLEEVTGFDSPDIRQNVEELPETDGAVAGDFFFGARPVTMSGKGAFATAAVRNVAVVNLQRALRGLRGDATLKSQASGLPAMQAAVRIQNVRVTGGFVKEFQIGLVCPDPRMYSQTLNTGTSTGTTSTNGASFPWSFPVSFGGGAGDTLTLGVTNAGNFDSPPVVRVWGPVSDPDIHNLTTGEALTISGVTLASGEYVDVDFSAKTVVANGSTSYYHRVTFPGSTWWQLAPGSNTVSVRASTSVAGVEMDVSWRDVWA